MEAVPGHNTLQPSANMEGAGFIREHTYFFIINLLSNHQQQQSVCDIIISIFDDIILISLQIGTKQSGPVDQSERLTITTWHAGRGCGVFGRVAVAADGLDSNSHTVGMETPLLCDGGEHEGPDSSSGY